MPKGPGHWVLAVPAEVGTGAGMCEEAESRDTYRAPGRFMHHYLCAGVTDTVPL